tara:strand:+ start:3008 stop:3892 length:885 start_codon:yes stop_codon:yes gene_type:complete
MTDSGVQTRNISQTQKATLNSIRDLQRLENQLYKKLEQTSATPNTLQEQRALIRRIDNITKVRKSLLNTLTDRYSDIQNNVISSRSDLVQQTAMVGVIQDEMRKANNNLTELETDKNNKLRMVELNTYARERYRSYMEMMRIFAIATFIVLILVVLGKKKIIPNQDLLIIIGGVVMTSALIMIIIRYLDIIKRDNLYFHKYDHPFDPDAIKHPTEEQNRQNMTLSLSGNCMNEGCCNPGQTYNKSIKKCVTSTVKESMETMNMSPYRTGDVVEVNSAAASPDAYDKFTTKFASC